MPTVLVQGGFKVRILLPPREHGPAHVHVHKAGGLVEANAAMLLGEWRRHHGHSPIE
jgi:hypothetical protein